MKKIQTGYLFFLFLFFVSSTGAFALGTTECFSPGVVTDFEALYSYAWNSDGAGHGMKLLIGGGVSETFSYYLAGAFSKEIPDEGDSVYVIGGFGAGLIWAAYEKEKAFEVNIIPGFVFEPNDLSDDGKTVKPDYKGLSYGAAFELNFMMLNKFQPFFIFGINFNKRNEEIAPDEFEDGATEYPFIVGFMIPIAEGIEFIGQLEWVMNEDTKKWSETERTIAAGVNFALNENLELNTEVNRTLKVEESDGEETDPATWKIGLGVTYAL